MYLMTSIHYSKVTRSTQ